MRVTWHEGNIVNRKSAWALVWVCVCAAVGGGVVSWSAVQCLAQHQVCVVVLGVLVVIVAGSRPVVLFEPGC